MNSECKIIKCCPKCGGTIGVSYLYQYSKSRIIGKRGKLLKKVRKLDCGPIDAALAYCTNAKCDVEWETDDFVIDDEDRFVDYKYCNLEE